MNNKMFYFLTLLLVPCSLLCADTEKFHEATKNTVSTNIEYVQAGVKHQCKKMKKKIKKLEKELNDLTKAEESNSEEQIDFELKKTSLESEIEKIEKKLDCLRSVNNAIEHVDFKAL